MQSAGHQHLGLEIELHPRSEQRHRFAERIAWIAMLMIIVAALLGFLGPGPLTRVEAAGAAGRLSIRCDRVLRLDAPADMLLRIAPIGDANEAEVSVSAAYLARMHLESIVPPPRDAIVQDTGTTFYFDTAEGAGPVFVRFRFDAATAGVAHVDLRSGGDRVSIRQFVLP